MAYQPQGIEYGKINGYTIYQFNNKYDQNYFISVPDEYLESYQLFLSFPDKDLKEKPQKEIIQEFEQMNALLKGINRNGIYMLPDISPNELIEATKENDFKKFNQVLNKLKPMIYEAYQTLINYNTAKKSINQVIEFVKKTESDRKFVDWLEINMPNFVYGITYDELKKQYYEKNENTKIFEDNTKEKQPDKKYTSGPLHNNPMNYVQQENSREIERTNIKVRKLVPNKKNQGFSNIFKTLLLLGIITLSGILISLFILK